MQTAAMYLPGYHQCPFNSSWWGEGFTEWDMVRRARPLADKHRQPRVPTWGYYDLSISNNISKQYSLAREFGIDGFCIYHYWSNGQRPLKTPIDLILSDHSIKVRFSLCWANHPWFSTWRANTGKTKRLLSQTYEKGEAQRKKHIDFLLKALSDDRAMRINDRPVLSIYRAIDVPQIDTFIDHLRSEAHQKYGLELFLSASVRANEEGSVDRLLRIFDSVKLLGTSALLPQLENQKGLYSRLLSLHQLKASIPNYLKSDTLRFLYWKLRELPCKEGPYTLDYDSFWQAYLKIYDSFSQRWPGKIDAQALIDWDNTPRMGPEGSYFFNFELDNLSQYVKQAAQKAMRYEPDSIFYLNAWNEWGEGSYLEPDEQFGYSRLETVSRAIQAASQMQPA